MTHELPAWFEWASLAAMVALLLADLAIVTRRPHVPSVRESALWVSFYVALALAFAGVLWGVGGGAPAGEFVTGWLTEYSLSVDNLFIFLLIMARIAVPHKNVQEMLMVGIILALIFRAIFIVVGVHLIAEFSWMFYLFGLLLLYTAINQFFTGEKDEENTENKLIKWLRKHVPVTARFHGAHLRMSLNGRKVFTPALLVFATLGTTDAILALDSVPVAFGITQNIFIIIAANVFALMGLRQLYFLLGTLVKKLAYLKYGISAILAFISAKLFITALHDNNLPFINNGQPFHNLPEIPTFLSLAFIVLAMSIAIIASVIKMRHDHRHA